MNETRIIVEAGLEAKIANIIEPEIDALGFRLVRVKTTGNNGFTVQIMAERPDGSMDVGGCEAVSRAISPILDIEDPVNKAYHLEISSPGIDRPLVRKSDFETWIGHMAKLETNQLINGRKRYKGVIVSVEGDAVNFVREVDSDEEDNAFIVPLNEIKDAKLVLTDDLITEALKRDKALREANGISDDDDASVVEN